MKQTRYTSIQRIILGCMIVVPAIPFMLTLIIAHFYFNSSLESTTTATIRRIVADHGRMIDTFLRERKSDLNMILQSNSIEDLSRPIALSGIFHQMQQESTAFIDLGVLNQSGDHVAYRGPFALEGRNYKQSDWFQHVTEKGVYISDVFLGYRQVPHFVMALLRENNGKKWILRATIDTQTFNDLVAAVKIGKTGEAYLVNTAGLFQTQRLSNSNLMEKDPNFTRYPDQSEKVQTFIAKDHTQKSYLYATTKLEEKDWLLVVRQEKEDAFSALRSASYRILIIAVIGGAFIVLIALYLSKTIVRKMEKIDREKGELGQQLVRASRLAELGEMSAGFAHEINNPLQIMKSELSLIQMVWRDIKKERHLPEDENAAQLADCLDQIQLQINRCGQITQGILKFGRQSEPSPQPIDLKEFIPDILKMINKQAAVNNIEISHRTDTDTPKIQGDPGQLQQVLLNLLNNAMDAIHAAHDHAGGAIRIETHSAANGRVLLLVKDNGCGVKEEDQKRVFSPFFTTKPVGKGTGLGLSVCYGIVQGMGGTMDFWSQAGKGTTFFIELPVAPDDSSTQITSTRIAEGI
ncbi:MAG: ATP-binding protein [Pseudomonadota bacterium]